jgi:hypothetical protein
VRSYQNGGGAQQLSLGVEGEFGIVSLKGFSVDFSVRYHFYQWNAHITVVISVAPPYGGMHRE